MTPAQCRAARGLLDWSQADLAKRSKISEKAVWDFEHEARTPYARTVQKLRAAFEKAGVAFIGRSGVKLK